MKKTMIRISAVVLTLCLLLGCIPLSVSAATGYTVSFDYDYNKGFAGKMFDGDTVSANTRARICVEPDFGYEVNEVYYINSGGSKVNLTYGGSAIPGQNNNFAYYFTMPSENVTVRVTFKDASKYRVTIQKIENGSAAVKGNYTYNEEYLDLYPGTDTDVYLYPESGYVLDSISLVGTNNQSAWIGNTSRYHTCRFDMPPYDCKLFVKYRPAVNDYKLTINQATGGYVYTSPSGDTFREDSYLQAYVNEDEGYRLDKLLVRQNDIYLVDADKVAFWYEFHMPSGDTTITPIFVERRQIDYIWLDADRNVLDQKTGYEGRKEPETSAVPQKAADAEGEYAFDHWEVFRQSYNQVIYYPVFRKVYHAAEFQDVRLSAATAYPGEYIELTASLMDMNTGKPIDRKQYSISLMKNGETVSERTTMAHVIYNGYTININDYFRIPENMEAGSYTLRLYYNGEEGEAVYDAPVAVLQQTNVNIALTTPRQATASESFTVEGKVTTDGGEPVANAQLLLRHSNTVSYQQAYTDGEGNFSTGMTIVREGLSTITVKTNNSKFRGGEAEAPIYISGDDHSVTVTETEHGSASADLTSAKCGDTVTLTAKPDNGYRFKEWEVVSGDVSMDGDSFIMLTQDVEIKPVFELNKHTVTIVLGDLGEDITVTVPYGVRFFNELDKEGVFNTLFQMETDDYIFRDLATKPLNEFADEEEYSEDAWELLDTKVISDMTVYAGFYKKIKNVELTLDPPVAGTEVTVTENDDIYTQTPAPSITLAPDAHCTVVEDSAVWYRENYEGGMLEGTFEKGKTYLADLILIPAFGYWLDDETKVTANGAEVVESTGRMALNVSLSTSPIAPYILGDANGDGAVTISDVTAIQRHLAELELLDVAHLHAADVNQDGHLNISDATLIQMYLAENLNDSPIGTLIG